MIAGKIAVDTRHTSPPPSQHRSRNMFDDDSGQLPWDMDTGIASAEVGAETGPVASGSIVYRRPSKRNPRSCDFCRVRKTVCRVEGSPPCVTCRSLGKDCIFSERTRKRAKLNRGPAREQHGQQGESLSVASCFRSQNLIESRPSVQSLSDLADMVIKLSMQSRVSISSNKMHLSKGLFSLHHRTLPRKYPQETGSRDGCLLMDRLRGITAHIPGQ